MVDSDRWKLVCTKNVSLLHGPSVCWISICIVSFQNLCEVRTPVPPNVTAFSDRNFHRVKNRP